MAARAAGFGFGPGKCQHQAVRPDMLYCSAQALGCHKIGRKLGVRRPNKSFKPKPLRYANHMAGKACHVLRSTARLGLTLALGGAEHVRSRQARRDVSRNVLQAFWFVAVVRSALFGQVRGLIPVVRPTAIAVRSANGVVLAPDGHRYQYGCAPGCSGFRTGRATSAWSARARAPDWPGF